MWRMAEAGPSSAEVRSGVSVPRWEDVRVRRRTLGTIWLCTFLGDNWDLFPGD